MKELLLFAFMGILAVQQTVLLSSSTTSTIVTSPAGHSTALDNYHNTNHPNFIGFGAKWIYKNGSSYWPYGDTATLQAQFYASCKLPATLTITADDTFSVSLNGVSVGSGANWQKAFKFNLNMIKCGRNTLVIIVTNLANRSPTSVIFAVTQDQTNCYTCKVPNSFYNKQTCQCQCLNPQRCLPPLAWFGYPTCACKCRMAQKCPVNQYWDERSCSCKCLEAQRCVSPLVWFAEPTCACKCPRVLTCPLNQYWDEKSCSCKCRNYVCPPSFILNPTTCKCQCQPRVCRYGMSWDYNLCKCVCGVRQRCENWDAAGQCMSCVQTLTNLEAIADKP